MNYLEAVFWSGFRCRAFEKSEEIGN